VPIYEYECQGCERQFQRLVMKKEDEEDLSCPACGGGRLKKLISRVTYHASARDRLKNFDPNARKSDSFYEDSRNIGLHAEKRAQQMGVDLGEGFRKRLDKLRTDPGSVLKDSE
jgi:putative FmdB family regulatory protein